ncbi:MLO-like protein 9 [Cryptomeria japonica]|uniref:MLO-like protein 9 n=1 Tax=Cryptomeria japonica TaxID=3369 RepID=UPI0027DAAF46|nr:MLO-like protein 9 [Cryptomeria japonica]
MAGGGNADSRSLEQTPTWAVAIVCFDFVIISMLIEQAIQFLSKWLKKRRKKALSKALEKIKAELMVLGFISLMLTVGQKPVSEICVSKSLGETLLPCSKEEALADHVSNQIEKISLIGQHHRKLLLLSASETPLRRSLATEETVTGLCAKKGKVPLISQDGLHQLHLFIFVLAISHVLSCIVIMTLGRPNTGGFAAPAKTNSKSNVELYCHGVMFFWSWELLPAPAKTNSKSNVELYYGVMFFWSWELLHPSKIEITHETIFKRIMSFCSTTPILNWIVCFFRQFASTKADYLTLCHSFELAPFNRHNKIDFQTHIKRSLDNDFSVLVSISPHLWSSAILFLLLNRHGWFIFSLVPFFPLIILLIMGTKMKVIITKMALDSQDRNPIEQEAPVVKPNNQLFWFGKPRLILHLIHFTLFQNAFQMAFFFWTWYEYGLKSCFHKRDQDIVVRISLGIGVQMLCSYVTLPLYALITQLGANMEGEKGQEDQSSRQPNPTEGSSPQHHHNPNDSSKEKIEGIIPTSHEDTQDVETKESVKEIIEGIIPNSHGNKQHIETKESIK